MNLLEPGGLRAGDVLTRRYLLMEQLGRGGMSVVWRGFDQSLQRMVAIKILEADLGTDRELIRREARATARLIHPDAIEVYDYGETVTSHGRLAAYVVMRLLEGRPLADRIVQGPLPWTEAVAVAGRLATVLAAAHERGVVHRDVTAENVLLTSDGAKLLDFGIAAFIGEDDDRTGEYGTPPYVAPERLTGRVADPASDVYSLGVLLFEMLTGATPYPERTWEEIENARREGPPPELRVPGLPPEVAALCRRCLAHDQ
ncbi:serine/threonine-protein kinase, partial [Planomonospora algeriensis]